MPWPPRFRPDGSARPEDIAYVFLFLASAEASYVNGQLLVVDGARSLAGLD